MQGQAAPSPDQMKLVNSAVSQAEKDRIARMQSAVAVGTCFGIVGAAIIGGVVYGLWKVIEWAL